MRNDHHATDDVRQDRSAEDAPEGRSADAVPEDHPDRRWAEYLDLSRRDALKLGGSIAATLAAGSAVGGAAPDYDVHLGEQGLSNGDLIDGYLNDYFGNGDTVFVPDGEYDWDGGGMDDPTAGSELVTNGSDRVTFNLNSGTAFTDRFYEPGIRISGFTVRGTADDPPKCGWDIQCQSDGGEIVFEDLRLPDGCVGEGRCFYIPEEGHAGRGVVRNVLMAGFSSDCGYTDTGSMTYENCVCIDNNISMIRVGRGDNYVRNCLLLYTGDARENENGDVLVRGIRVREEGQTTIEGCDIVWTSGQAPSNPIEIHEDAPGATGVVRDTRIHNDTDRASVNLEADQDFDAEGLHLTGSTTDATGISGTVYKGSDADAPRDDYTYDGDPANFSGGPLGDDSDDGGDGGSNYDHHLVYSVSGGYLDVSVTIDGDVDYGPESEGDEPVVDNGDGTYTVSSEHLGNGYADSWYYTGEVVDYEVTEAYDDVGSVSVTLDGESTTFEELVSSPTERHVAYTVSDGYLDVSMTVDGEVEYGDEAEGDEPITQNPDGTYTVSSEHLGNGYADSWYVTGDVVDYEVTEAYDDVGTVSVTVDGESTTFADLVANPTDRHLVYSVSDGYLDVSVTVDGAVDYGPEAEGDEPIVDNGDGTATVSSEHLGNGYADSWNVSGEFVDYTVTEAYDDVGTVSVTLDGESTTFEELVN